MVIRAWSLVSVEAGDECPGGGCGDLVTFCFFLCLVGEEEAPLLHAAALLGLDVFVADAALDCVSERALDDAEVVWLLRRELSLRRGCDIFVPTTRGRSPTMRSYRPLLLKYRRSALKLCRGDAGVFLASTTVVHNRLLPVAIGVGGLLVTAGILT